VIADLHIRNLGVIAEADLALSSGMVVFSGETGAGKTVLVGALGLVLGDRADTALVAGDRAEVSARVVVDPDGAMARRVEELGGAVEADGTLTVARTVAAAGRSRAALGGAAVPVAVLAEVGGSVAQRHSQSDQISLRSGRRQRQSLDAYGGTDLADALARYRDTYDRFVEQSEGLRRAQHDRAENRRRLAAVQEGLARIDELSPQPGEDRTLPDEIARLANTEHLSQQAAEALAALSDDDGGAAAALLVAGQALGRAAAVDGSLTALSGRLGEVMALVSELDADLRRYTDGLNRDPAVLDSLQRRRAALTALQRDYGPTLDDVLTWQRSARTEAAALQGADADEAEALERIAALVADLAASAAIVSRLRVAAAERLGAAVSAELRDLAMPHARFTVAVAQQESDSGLALPDGRSVAFGRNGVDTVAFLLAPHPGADPAPIGDGASGGELSRIMLALEVVLAQSDPPAVFVFDEVDAGIGGRTAVEVGRRLARLARRSQVLVVTHLAQVAAFADQHVVVRKDSGGRVTRSSVCEAAGGQRRRELARMLSGQDDSPAALAHAQELLALAAGRQPDSDAVSAPG
jgi:DNA repair protein RecN (Recombination protein N)